MLANSWLILLLSVATMVLHIAKVDASTIAKPMVTEVKLLEPDQYGQRHPVETEDLILHKLEEMDETLTVIPPSKKQSLCRAEKLCPEILTDEFKLRFLRCEVFNAQRAAQRYISYWKKRH